MTQSRPAGPLGSDRSALRSGRKVTSRVELVQPERARRGVRPVLRSVAVCLEEAWIAYAAKAVSLNVMFRFMGNKAFYETDI